MAASVLLEDHFLHFRSFLLMENADRKSDEDITDEMIAAGVTVLQEHFLATDAVDEYPLLVRTLYEAMQASRLKS
jgi:hypothetical protein